MITNTAKTPTILDGLPGMIEASELRGQAELVGSALLPTNMRGEREKFEKMGFVFGDVVKDDPLFINATLPSGWKKEHTDHSMWSKIVDDKWNERAKIFYKAAFYDRRADMSLSGRYRIDGPHNEATYGKNIPCEAKIIDQKTGETIYSVTREAGPKDYNTSDSNANQAAREWLEKNRPNWCDPLEWLKD